MKGYTVANEIKEFISELEEMGLEVRKGKGGHHKVFTSNGTWVIDFASTSGDFYWKKQATRRLRKKLQRLYGTRVVDGLDDRSS